MNKKVLTVIALIVIFGIGLFVLTGCGNKEDNKIENNIEESKTKYDTFKIYDETLELDYERTFQKMTYKTNSEKMYPNTSSNSVALKYEDETKTEDIVDDYGASVVRVNIQYFENRSIDEVMSKAPYERTNKTVGNYEYQYFEFTDNGANGYTYIYNFEGSTYTITFMAKIDINTLIDAFMKNVKFE